MRKAGAPPESLHDILGLTFTEFADIASRILASGKGAAGAVYAGAFAKGVLDANVLGLVPASIRGWEDNFRVGLLEPCEAQEEEGEFGVTVKATMRLADGAEIECVRVPMPSKPDGKPRSSICVSSQVGCRMGCAFCETGQRGFVRNLGASEIVSELVTARAILGWDVGNVVFMGMGEPLDNLDNVAKALAVMTDGRGLGLSWERLTVCTSGDAGKIKELRRLGHPRLNLSLILNAAEDTKRDSIMPYYRRSNLDALAEALVAYPGRRNFVLALNWCLLPGINDSREDARMLGGFSRRIGRSIVNLIPYNPGALPIARAPEEEEVARFRSWLEEEGCMVKLRSLKGRDIMAGCGQLGGSSRKAPATG
ncbi:MAG: radical SAM protein [Spirochaetota bacterium]